MTIDTAETLGEHYGRAIENPENYERMKEQYISTAAEALPAIGDLTARKILRANPSLGKAAAAKLAAEVHDIIRCVREFGDVFGHPYGVEDDPDEIETLVEMLLRHAAKDGTDDGDWVMDMLTHIDGRLYARYLFVCDIA
jgi:hypothetical protein